MNFDFKKIYYKMKIWDLIEWKKYLKYDIIMKKQSIWWNNSNSVFAKKNLAFFKFKIYKKKLYYLLIGKRKWKKKNNN